VDDMVGCAHLWQLGRLFGGQGLAEEVALSFCATLVLKVCSLFLRFNALGNHQVLEALSHVNYGAHDGRVIGIGSDLVDKGLVNLRVALTKSVLTYARDGICVGRFRQSSSC
jgi:hypothetical protein